MVGGADDLVGDGLQAVAHVAHAGDLGGLVGGAGQLAQVGLELSVVADVVAAQTEAVGGDGESLHLVVEDAAVEGAEVVGLGGVAVGHEERPLVESVGEGDEVDAAVGCAVGEGSEHVEGVLHAVVEQGAVAAGEVADEVGVVTAVAGCEDAEGLLVEFLVEAKDAEVDPRLFVHAEDLDAVDVGDEVTLQEATAGSEMDASGGSVVAGDVDAVGVGGEDAADEASALVDVEVVLCRSGDGHCDQRQEGKEELLHDGRRL